MSIRKATARISPWLRSSVKFQRVNKPAPNWRIHRNNFIRKTSRHILEPGAINFSAGWLGQGHAVRFYFALFNYLFNYPLCQAARFPLLPSANLRTQIHWGSNDWIKIAQDLEIFLNLTLSLINPGLFKTGLEMLRRMRNLEDTEEISQRWQSVYSGISVISNRSTPSHRDSKGRLEWYDTLVSYAGPGARPLLTIKDLGLHLKYSSGTVVGLCGTILEHQVSSWGVGDRVCYAHFMRENVRERLGVQPAGWVNQEMYLNNDIDS